MSHVEQTVGSGDRVGNNTLDELREPSHLEFLLVILGPDSHYRRRAERDEQSGGLAGCLIILYSRLHRFVLANGRFSQGGVRSAFGVTLRV